MKLTMLGCCISVSRFRIFTSTSCKTLTVKLAKFKNSNTSDVFLGGENLIHLSAHSHFSSGEYKGGLPQYTCVCCMVQRYAVGITVELKCFALLVLTSTCRNARLCTHSHTHNSACVHNKYMYVHELYQHAPRCTTRYHIHTLLAATAFLLEYLTSFHTTSTPSSVSIAR